MVFISTQCCTTPYDIALARTVIRDFCRRDPTKKQFDNKMMKLDQTLTIYLNSHRNTYIQHKNTVEPFCDLVVDGTKPLNIIAEEITNKINHILFDKNKCQ